MMSMWTRWAPPLERSRLVTFSGSGCNFGAFVALPLTGYICQTLGWPAVFYICGEAGERGNCCRDTEFAISAGKYHRFGAES